MSRLDSFIRRLEAQRACLGMAAQAIADLYTAWGRTEQAAVWSETAAARSR